MWRCKAREAYLTSKRGSPRSRNGPLAGSSGHNGPAAKSPHRLKRSSQHWGIAMANRAQFAMQLYIGFDGVESCFKNAQGKSSAKASSRFRMELNVSTAAGTGWRNCFINYQNLEYDETTLNDHTKHVYNSREACSIVLTMMARDWLSLRTFF